jgi:hypothetical protein
VTGRPVKRCLVINPNTTAAVTDLVLAACRRAQPDVQWDGTTARFGAAYIASEAAYARASHAALDAFETAHDGQDAVLLACFGDPGLMGLRELSPVPVVGLAQSSFQAAARHGRFAVVTGGHAWAPMLARFARAHELDRGLTGIHTIDWTGAQIAADPDGARDFATPARPPLPTCSTATSASPAAASWRWGRACRPARARSTPAGRLVTPGGVDAHCHLDQPMPATARRWPTTSTPARARRPAAAPPR